MCGITGYYHFKKEFDSSESALTAATAQLNKRGPDHQATLSAPGIGLGHTRLSIIDLTSHAHQPMSDKSGRYSIIFNGEIFNYKSLGKEIGVESSSDTEILLYAFIKWKDKCLEKLRGFFAFAIYDREEHSLFIARDRYGIKPLLYSHDHNSFYFSSELKSLLCFPIKRELDPKAFEAFFQLSYIPSPFSIMENVKKLKPGHFIKVKIQDVQFESYVTLKPGTPYGSYDEAKEDLVEKMNLAVQDWMFTDAPLGAFLSGGLDSSIIVALASQKIKNLKTYSVTFPDSPFHDEGQYSQLIADKFGTSHHVIPLSNQDLYQNVNGILDYMDEPFADSSIIPTFALCKEVSRHVKVALSGDGADEVFGGYEKYRGEFLARKFPWISPLNKLLSPITSNFPESRDSYFFNLIRKGNRFAQGTALSDDERYWQWSSFNSKQLLDKIIQKRLNSNNWQADIFPASTKLFQGLNQVLVKDMIMVLEGDMLRKVDMASMSNSLEVRPVFLDHLIVEAALRMPENYKVTWNYKKKILIDSYKDLIPSEVYERPKHGFSIELLPFFRNQFWEKINDLYLNESFVKEQGIFDYKEIENLKRHLKNGQGKDIQALIWSLITFQNFWLKYMEK